MICSNWCKKLEDKHELDQFFSDALLAQIGSLQHVAGDWELYSGLLCSIVDSVKLGSFL